METFGRQISDQHQTDVQMTAEGTEMRGHGKKSSVCAIFRFIVSLKAILPDITDYSNQTLFHSLIFGLASKSLNISSAGRQLAYLFD